MILAFICGLLAVFFGLGMLVEIYEERDFPRYTAPRFLFFAVFTAITAFW